MEKPTPKAEITVTVYLHGTLHIYPITTDAEATMHEEIKEFGVIRLSPGESYTNFMNGQSGVPSECYVISIDPNFDITEVGLWIGRNGRVILDDKIIFDAQTAPEKEE